MGDLAKKFQIMWRGGDPKTREGESKQGKGGKKAARKEKTELDGTMTALVDAQTWFQKQLNQVLPQFPGHQDNSKASSTGNSRKGTGQRKQKNVDGKEVVKRGDAVESAASENSTMKKVDDNRTFTILILGTSGSGKSTLVQQIDAKYSFEYGTMYPKEWIKRIRQHILINICNALRELTSRGVDFGEMTGMKDDFITAYTNPRPAQLGTLSPVVARNLKLLWSSKAVQRNLNSVSKGVHLEFMDVFIRDLDRIAAPSYVPTIDDILHAHVKTTGIWEGMLNFNGYDTFIRDVGGVQSERHKWRATFNGVDAVIFVAAVGEFDQMLYEDHRTNSFDESLNLFKDLVQSRGVFKTWTNDDIPIFLILNKTDMLLDKLEQTDKLAGRLKTSMLLSYDGPNLDDGVSKDAVFEYVSEHIKKQFMKCNEGTKKHVFPFFLNATDVDQFDEMFNAVMEILINEEY